MAYIKSDILVNHLEESGEEYPYASAFGYCWVLLTNEQKLRIFDLVGIKEQN